MQIEKLRSLIREAVDNQLKEIEAVAEAAAMEARLAEYDKAIKTCESKIQAAENLEEVKELVDENKLNELKKKLKSLTKAKEKLEKAKAKKNKGKEVTTDAETDKEETVDETYVEETAVEETYTMDEMENDSMKEEALNESFLKMQKLAGVITETQYNQKKKLIENQLNEIEYAGIKKIPTSGDNYQLTIDAEKWSGQKGGGDHVIALFKNGTLYTTDGSWDWKAEPKSNEVKSLLKKYVEDNKIEKLSPDMSKLLGVVTENQLDEAEKTIQAFGPRLMDGLKKDGFDAKFTTNDLEHEKLQNIVKAAEDKKLAVVYYLPQGKYISITTNKNNQDAAFKVVNSGFVQDLLPDGFQVSKSGAFFVEIQGK